MDCIFEIAAFHFSFTVETKEELGFSTVSSNWHIEGVNPKSSPVRLPESK
jgi:hypothetical protein